MLFVGLLKFLSFLKDETRSHALHAETQLKAKINRFAPILSFAISTTATKSSFVFIFPHKIGHYNLDIDDTKSFCWKKYTSLDMN